MSFIGIFHSSIMIENMQSHTKQNLNEEITIKKEGKGD